MTQAGRQGSPRNSSGRNSAGRNSAGRNAGQGGAAAQGGRDFPRAATSRRAAETVPSSTPSLAKRPSSIRTCKPAARRGCPARRPGAGSSNSPAAKDAARKAGRPEARLWQRTRHARRPQAQAADRRRQGGRPPRLRQRTLRPEPRAGAQARPQPRTAPRGAAVGVPRRRRHPPAEGHGLCRCGLTPRLRGNDRRRPRRGRRPGCHRARRARRPEDRGHPRRRPAHPAGREHGLHGLQQAQGRCLHHGGPGWPPVHQRLRPQLPRRTPLPCGPARRRHGRAAAADERRRARQPPDAPFLRSAQDLPRAGPRSVPAGRRRRTQGRRRARGRNRLG